MAVSTGSLAEERTARRCFVVLSLICCAVLVAYSLHLGSELRYPDERDYLALADHLLDGDGYSLDGTQPSVLRPPGYPVILSLLLAPAKLVGVEPDTGALVHFLRLTQLGLLIVGVCLLARLRPAESEWPYWTWCAVMTLGLLFYPVLLYASSTLFPQAVLGALLCVVLVLAQQHVIGDATAIGIGLIGGLVVEISPTALVVLPVLVGFALLSPHWRRRHVVMLVLAALLLPTLWLVRNVVVFDQFVVFSRNLAFNIDNSVLEADPLAVGEARPANDALGYGVERLTQLLTAPGLYLEKLLGYFHYRNDLHVTSESTGLRDAIMFVTYYSLIALVLLRLALYRLRGLSRVEWLILSLYIGTALFHALVFTRIRYRLPFDLLLLLPAVNALSILRDHQVGIRRQRAARQSGDSRARTCTPANTRLE